MAYEQFANGGLSSLDAAIDNDDPAIPGVELVLDRGQPAEHNGSELAGKNVSVGKVAGLQIEVSGHARALAWRRTTAVRRESARSNP
jgi:hypothetical protein